MNQTKLEILGRLLKQDSITLEEAFLLMQTEKQYIPYYHIGTTSLGMTGLGTPIQQTQVQ